MGDVLMDLDSAACIREFRRLGFKDVDKMLDTAHQMGYFGQLESGQIDVDEFYNRCLSECSPGTCREDIFRAMRAFNTGVESYKVALVKELRTRYRIAMLSNNNPIALSIYADYLSQMGVRPSDLVDKTYFSFELGLLKPSEAIFHHMIDDLGVEAEEIFFVDDSQRNVDAATSLGIKARRYEPRTDLRALLEGLL